MTSKQGEKKDYIFPYINIEGKGGFKDHPELINVGGRPKNQESYAYWLNYFKNIPYDEFKNYKKNNPNMTMAAIGAYARVERSENDLKEFQDTANRTEGMPTQRIEQSGTIELREVRLLSDEELNDRITRSIESPNKGGTRGTVTLID